MLPVFLPQELPDAIFQPYAWLEEHYRVIAVERPDLPSLSGFECWQLLRSRVDRTTQDPTRWRELDSLDNLERTQLIAWLARRRHTGA